ncbi:hypothetical protein [Amycolatopsis sp. lyj-109]|uniref:hypothetical protein n=1 Tax=Amycolatopsis sp. lyj-109 TaxID=2789287 RepID=UPI00397CD02C
MTAEWLTPTGTIVGAMITAGFGGWLGGRRSKKEQDTQHRFEREQALAEHGRDKVDGAISSLYFLQGHSREAAEVSNQQASVEHPGVLEQHQRLERALPYLTNAQVRADAELVHGVIRDAWLMVQFGDGYVIGSAQEIVWRVCREGIALLGRYLRMEPHQTSAELDRMRRIYDEANHAFGVYLGEIDEDGTAAEPGQ